MGVGAGSVGRTSRRTTVVRALMGEMYHRALMAFPDEDVIIGARIDDPSGFELFDLSTEVVPRPGHRPSGEERAWARPLRQALRPRCRAASTTVRSSSPATAASRVCGRSRVGKPDKIDAEVGGCFDGVDPDHGDHLVAFAWVDGEHLEKLGSSRTQRRRRVGHMVRCPCRGRRMTRAFNR